jgi:hypothetical protein
MTRRESRPVPDAPGDLDGPGSRPPATISTDRIKRDTGTRIVEAAAQAAARFGVSRWTIDDVAACAGMSRRPSTAIFPPATI